MVSLDSAMNNDFLMITKLLIPYLDRDKQKAVAIFIKSFELMSTIDLFSKEDFMDSFSQPRNNGWEKKFLHDIKTNLSDERAYFIDAILKLSEVKDLLAVKNTEPFNPNYPNNTMTSSSEASFKTPSSASSHTSPSANLGNGPSSHNATEVLDKLAGVLEPNQLQILKVLSSFMK